MKTESVAKLTNKIPVFQDVMFLFQFISYTGASIFIPCGENPSRRMRLLHFFQQGACFIVFLLLLIMSILEIYQFINVIWNMDNIGEVWLIKLRFLKIIIATSIFLWFKR